MSNLQKYGSFSMDAASQEKDSLGAKSADYMKLEVGRNVVRFLPPAPGKRSPFVVIHQHFIKPIGADKPIVFACPRAMEKRACPVCAKADQFARTGNKADRDKAFELYPSRRVFANVIDRRTPEAGVKVLGFGKKIHEQLLNLRTDEDAGGDYTHPVDGFDVVITREGTGKTDTKYHVAPARKQSMLAPTEEEIDALLEAQPDLERFARVPTPEELQKLLNGGESEDSGARTVEVSRQPPKRAARSAQDDVEDDAFGDEF